MLTDRVLAKADSTMIVVRLAHGNKKYDTWETARFLPLPWRERVRSEGETD